MQYFIVLLLLLNNAASFLYFIHHYIFMYLFLSFLLFFSKTNSTEFNLRLSSYLSPTSPQPIPVANSSPEATGSAHK